VLEHGHVPLLVGGAGFYLRALREGFLDVDADPQRLARLRAEHQALGDEELRARLAAVDPATAKKLHPNDRYRIGRALEIFRLTGRPLSEHERDFQPRPILDARFEVLHLSPPREELHRRIEARTERWLDGRWRAEVDELLAAGVPADAPGLRILGYREVVDWVRGGLDRDACAAAIVTRTRQYARQQETWFRKEEARWRGGDPEAGRQALIEALQEAAVPLS
jgi:tRNA dimethylallyltransferase